jgi:hypothetical protein
MRASVWSALDDDPALEHAPRLAVNDALGQLAGDAAETAVRDDGGCVRMSLILQQIGPVEPDARALPRMGDMGLDSLATGAGGEDGLGVGRAGGEGDGGGRDGDALGPVGGEDYAFQPAALGDLDIERNVRYRAVGQRFVAFQQGQRLTGSHDDQHPGRDRTGLGGHEAQLGDRAVGAALDVREALDEPIGHEEQVAAERRERPLCGHLGRARRRRQRAQQPAQVRPAPVLVPARRELGQVAGGDGFGEGHLVTALRASTRALRALLSMT